MTELEALRRVAEAAQILAHSCGGIRGRTPEDDDLYTVELEHIRELNTALDALPAPAAEGETVEVRIALYHQNEDDNFLHVWLEPGQYSQLVPGPQPSHWTQFATIRARVPLPVVPEIVGEVEG